jgi:hypothetical protein
MSIADIASRLATRLNALATRLRNAPTKRAEWVTYADLREGDAIVCGAREVGIVESIEWPFGRRRVGAEVPRCNVLVRHADGHAGTIAGPYATTHVERVARWPRRA